MRTPEVTFTEATAERRIEEVPLSHLSIEVGHLYLEDFARGPDHLCALFRQVRPWLPALRAAALTGSSARPRISTCFLVDDYFSRFGTPATVLPPLLGAAAEEGVPIDYLARESACADFGGVRLAELVEARIVDDPPPDTDGSRPPLRDTGWLSNGRRSPGARVQEAMSKAEEWAPPVENAKRNHSVFVDVELWDDRDGRRVWSCSMLAAVWQLLRLGLLRDQGRSVGVPVPEPAGGLSDSWDELPGIVRLRPEAAPFCAYRTASVLASRFLPIELAVRLILGQVAVDPAVDALTVVRSGREGVGVPAEVVDRISYVFSG